MPLPCHQHSISSYLSHAVFHFAWHRHLSFWTGCGTRRAVWTAALVPPVLTTLSLMLDMTIDDLLRRPLTSTISFNYGLQQALQCNKVCMAATQYILTASTCSRYPHIVILATPVSGLTASDIAIYRSTYSFTLFVRLLKVDSRSSRS